MSRLKILPVGAAVALLVLFAAEQLLAGKKGRAPAQTPTAMSGVNYRAGCDHSSHKQKWWGPKRTDDFNAAVNDANLHNIANDGHKAVAQIGPY